MIGSLRHPGWSTAHHGAQGMTLLETIAVLVILSGVVTVSLGMIGPMSASASRREVIAVVEVFFDRARLLSQRSGGAVITAGEALTATPVRGSSGDPDASALVITRSLPEGWSCQIRERMDSPPIESMILSGNGAGVDCAVILANQRGDIIVIERLGAGGQMRVWQDVEGITP